MVLYAPKYDRSLSLFRGSSHTFLGSAVVVDLASYITHLESDATVATSDDDVLPLDHAMRHRVSLYLFCSKKTEF